MITNTLVTSTDITVPVKVFTSTNTGAPIGGSVVGQTNAVVGMILCNTSAKDITDETIGSVDCTIHLVKSGESPIAANTIVSNLTIPAAETVFFSDEKLVLDSGDEIWVGTTTGSVIAFTVSTLKV